MEINVNLDELCLDDLLLKFLALSEGESDVNDYVWSLVTTHLDQHPDARVCANPECACTVPPIIELHPTALEVERGYTLRTRPCGVCPTCEGALVSRT